MLQGALDNAQTLAAWDDRARARVAEHHVAHGFPPRTSPGAPRSAALTMPGPLREVEAVEPGTA